MKIQATPMICTPIVQSRIAKALVDGTLVEVPLPAKQEIPELAAYLRSAEVLASAQQLAARYGQQPVLMLNPALQQNLLGLQKEWTKEQKLALGVTGGVVTGAGVGVLLSIVNSVAPKTGAAMTLACTLVGGGLAAAMASGTVGSVTGKLDPKTGKIELELSGPKKA